MANAPVKAEAVDPDVARWTRFGEMHDDHVANEVIGLPRNADTAGLYRMWDHMMAGIRIVNRSLDAAHAKIERVEKRGR